MSRKICVVITARASYARVRSLLRAIRDHEELELQLVVAASALLERYGSVHEVIEREGFAIDRRVYMIVEGENLVTSAKSVGLGVVELATAFSELRPDLVVTIADRFETMATAIAASYQNIPLVHLQGGEITGSIDDKVRHAITKLADLHFPATQRAAERVIRLGEAPDRVFALGCPSIDLVQEALREPLLASGEFFRRYGGVGDTLDLDGEYIVVLQHPVTTEYEAARRHVDETLHAIAESATPTLWFWPNVDAGSDGTSKGIRAYRETHRLPHVHFFKNLPPEVFLRVVNRSACIVGNSSVAIRECSFMGVPAVNIGSRQRGRERGRNVVDIEHDRKQIREATERCMALGRIEGDALYGVGDAGVRIADQLTRVPLDVTKRLTF